MDWFCVLQRCLPQVWLSEMFGFLANQSQPIALKNWAIRKFVRQYGVNLQEAQYENPEEYQNFNQFFTRALKPEARFIDPHPKQVIAPVDGHLSQFGKIEQGQLLQAKGHSYSLLSLLGGNEIWTSNFNDGYFLCYYLAPKDYHRVHMPMAGTLRETLYVPGRLFSVNSRMTRQIPGLFAQNERLICMFDTALGPMSVILVGAMIVASLHTQWAGTVNAPRHSSLLQQNWQHQQLHFTKGAEIGYFKLGSTVIVCFPDQKNVAWVWDPDLQYEKNIRLGQIVAKYETLGL